MRSRTSSSPVSSVTWVRRSSAKSPASSVSSVLMTPCSFGLRVEDRLELLDRLLELVELVAQLLALELGEPAQLHVEDVVRLDLGELERLRHEPGARRLDVGRAADEGDDRVDHVEGADEALDDVGAVLGLAQPVLRPPGDDLDLVLDVDLDRLGQVEQPRDAVDEREHVHGEARLHRRVLVELVQHDLGVGVALQLDDEAVRDTRRLVADVADALDLALVHELGDLLPDDLDRRLVRDLGDDDAQLAAACPRRSRRRRACWIEPRPVR